MITKQKIGLRRVSIGMLALLGIAVTLSIGAPSAYADPASSTVTCKDGKTKTAHKTDKPDTSILDDKDFAYACRNNGGYKPADSTGTSGTTDTSGSSNTVLNDQVAGDGCGGVQTAIIKCDATNKGNKLENNGIWALLLIVINVMTAGVGVLAVAGIVYGSILYTTAEDKADQVNKATDIIRNVIIGLVAFALMWALLNFIIPGGVFSA